ncbi:MAG: enoyl-CoA hydratase/isomerase family protein, partial [Flavisolibacter sp.]
MYQTLLTQLQDGIFTITVNRPDKLNALNRDVIKELGMVIKEAEENNEIKGVILTGAGPKAFVAGADISEFTGLSVAEGRELAKKGSDIFFLYENCSKPVIAAVNGFALGGGCELAMACHFRIASEQARFGQPEVNLGLIPGYGGTQRLVHLIGKGRALELLMTGNMLDARTAHQYGLVNHVVTAEELLSKAIQLMEQIISKAPLAISR